jgi:hypothetical protein
MRPKTVPGVALSRRARSNAKPEVELDTWHDLKLIVDLMLEGPASLIRWTQRT